MVRFRFLWKYKEFDQWEMNRTEKWIMRSRKKIAIRNRVFILFLNLAISNAPMIYGIIVFLEQTEKKKKRQKQMLLSERIKQSFEVDAPPVGENWRGGVRKCACLAEDCSTSPFSSSSLPMPCNAIHYSSTTWTSTFGGCRIDVFDLMFCCCHLFSLFSFLFFHKEVLLELTFTCIY